VLKSLFEMYLEKEKNMRKEEYTWSGIKREKKSEVKGEFWSLS